MKKVFACLLTSCLLLLSCGDDDFEYPNIVTELAEITISSSAENLIQFSTDKGERWTVVNKVKLEGIKSDSIYRTIATYEPQSEDKAILYNLQFPIASLPINEAEVEGAIKTDPVEMQRMWKTDRYLNAVVEVMVKDKKHSFAFIDKGYRYNSNGTKTLQLLLSHDRDNDIEGFTEKVYLSIPIWTYENELQAGDSICFELNTVKEGFTTKTIPY